MADHCRELDISVGLDALRSRLRKTSDDLMVFGVKMRNLIYPLRYRFDGKPVVCAFSIQLDEARAEWRWRDGTPQAKLYFLRRTVASSWPRARRTEISSPTAT
jgi:hypothetical protein